MRRNRLGQLGEGQIGCVISLLILLAVGYVCFKMIPVKVKAAELRAEAHQEAKSAGLRDNKKIRKNIMLKAKDLDLPLRDEDLIITRGGNVIRVNGKYTVVVEFPGYTHNWDFQFKAEYPIF